MKRLCKYLLLFIILSLSFFINKVYADNNIFKLENVEVKDKSGTITVVDPIISNNEITSSIKFNQIDDFVTFELTIVNQDKNKYKIKSIEDNNKNNNIKIEYSFNEEYIKKGEKVR